METLKEKALAKMLEEMNHEHSAAEDRIHNWLCEQNDETLFDNIIKEGKSIAGALRFAQNKARKKAINNVTVVEDQTVYDWVVEYFAVDKIDETTASVPTRKLGVEEEKAVLKRQKEAAAKARAEVEEKARKEAEKARKAELKKAGAVEGQMAIFDLL